uniref:Uncharacterized protein n=1 Tax=Romanomermis culicivorax TaxID=13658 RepID=A0A915KNK5_ROMCU
MIDSNHIRFTAPKIAFGRKSNAAFRANFDRSDIPQSLRIEVSTKLKLRDWNPWPKRSNDPPKKSNICGGTGNFRKLSNRAGLAEAPEIVDLLKAQKEAKKTKEASSANKFCVCFIAWLKYKKNSKASLAQCDECNGWICGEIA